MEITSYGGLIPGQSEEDFFSCSSMPRNRELMRVFKDVGLVEQLGSGMSRILQAYSRSIFQIFDHFIKVVFPFSQPQSAITAIGGNAGGNVGGNVGGINGDDRNMEKQVLDCMLRSPNITTKQMVSLLQISERTLSRVIRTLRENGKITRIGSPRKGEWKVNE